MAQRFKIRDDRHRRVYENLRRLIGEGAAAFFLDMCRVIDADPPFAAATHLVAHALREIEGTLRDVLVPIRFGRRTPQAKDNENGHRISIDEACEALGTLTSDPLREQWRSFAGRGNPSGFAERAHRNDIARPRPLDEEFLSLVRRAVGLFDSVLLKADGRYVGVFEALDRLLAIENPQPQDIETFAKLPQTLVAHDYFFRRLDHHRWLEPLIKTGLLGLVPALDRDDDAGTITFPAWPTGRFLQRIAEGSNEAAQELTVSVINAIPETDNARFYADVAQIATALPAALADLLVPLVVKGIRLPHQLHLPHRVPDLVKHLATNGLVDSACSVAMALLEFRPQADALSPTESQAKTEPRLHAELYPSYLKKIAATLIAHAPWQAFRLLTELALQALRSEHGTEEPDASRIYDFSYIWWPDVESDDDLHDTRAQLLSTTFKAAAATVTSDPSRLSAVLKILDDSRWDAFRRVGLALLAHIPSTPPDLCDSVLFQSIQLYDEPSFRQDYARLLRKRLTSLVPDKRLQILEALYQAPDVESRNPDHGMSEAELETAQRRAVYERLYPVTDLLVGRIQLEYDALASQLGQYMEHRERGLPTLRDSPKAARELLDMSEAQLTTYLLAVKLGHDLFGPSMEGLGDQLRSASQDAPRRMSTLADKLVGMDPVLVSSLLQGLQAALRVGAEVSWPPVLALCAWAIQQSDPENNFSERQHIPGWRWARRMVVSMLVEGLRRSPSQIPLECREDVWNLLATLLHDPDPEVERESGTDCSEVALNSTRGEAVRGAILYGCWVRRLAQIPESFTALPELKEALDRKLDPIAEPSPAIRSVYGEMLPTLYYLDSEWVTDAVERIFPTGKWEDARWSAAWLGYVRYAPFLPEVAELLDQHYIQAARRPSPLSDDKDANRLAERRLAEHLAEIMLLPPTESQERVIAAFFASASAPQCGSAIAALGRALGEADPVLEPIRRQELMLFWESRVHVAQTEGIHHRKEELERFVSWCSSGQFQPEWCLGQLEIALGMSAVPKPLDAAFEYFRAQASAHTLPVLRCLQRLLQGVEHDWEIDYSEDAIRETLATSLASADAKASSLASEIVSQLLSRGMHSYRDLLSILTMQN